MGGPNSGRRPGPEAIVKRMSPQISPVIAQPGGLTFPPTMHIKDEALKSTSGALLTDAPSDGTTYGRKDAAWVAAGAGGGHTIQDEGTPLTQRTNLNFSGSGVSAIDDAGNDATIVNIATGGSETDPIFMVLSGSLPYLKLVDSGSLDYAASLGADDNYVTDAEKVVIGNTSGTNTGDQTSIVGITGTIAQFNTALTDGNFVTAEADPLFFALSGSLPYLLLTQSGSLSYIKLTQSGSLSYVTLAASGSIPVGGDATGSVSSIQIDHVNIASIGTNTHAQIDTHIADTSDPHGATLTQTHIANTGTFSGARGYITNDQTLSGSAYIANVIHTSGSDVTASLHPIGSLLITYTP